MSLYRQTFEKLWEQYVTMCPSALKIHDLLQSKGELVNDHIALRTLDDSRINSTTLASHFENLGYVKNGHYYFKEKQLNAIHLEHPDEKAPKVFISELICSSFSESLQDILKKLVEDIPDQWYGHDGLIFQGRLWDTPSYAVYERLRQESEYAGWFYVYGFCANHFTVFVNYLQAFKDLTALNDFLKENGFSMNTSGGIIKGGPAVYLEQSSIMADKIAVEFKEGTYEIPGCYYEFAYRYKQGDSFFKGFVEQSADKIFESTDKKDKE